MQNNQPGAEPGRETGATTDWASEREYWRSNYASRPYVSVDRDFGFYEPGYRYGLESAHRYPRRRWEHMENDLERDWSTYRDRGTAAWNDIKAAARDAWDRVRDHAR